MNNTSNPLSLLGQKVIKKFTGSVNEDITPPLYPGFRTDLGA